MRGGELSSRAIQQGLKPQLIGLRIFYRRAMSSTMDVAHRQAERGAPEGTVVLAEEQTRGRGRFARAWVSPAGVNLYLSVILRPRLTELNQMNMAAALAVVRTIKRSTSLSPMVKWPNDVRLGGRKVCGILIESSFSGEEVQYAVVGIGLNVNLDTDLHQELAPIATSLMKETGKPLPRTKVLHYLLEEFDSLYRSLKEGISPRQEWIAHLETLGQQVQVRWGQQAVEGLAKAVDAEGNLMIEGADGSLTTVLAGEVTLRQ